MWRKIGIGIHSQRKYNLFAVHVFYYFFFFSPMRLNLRSYNQPCKSGCNFSSHSNPPAGNRGLNIQFSTALSCSLDMFLLLKWRYLHPNSTIFNSDKTSVILNPAYYTVATWAYSMTTLELQFIPHIKTEITNTAIFRVEYNHIHGWQCSYNWNVFLSENETVQHVNTRGLNAG